MDEVIKKWYSELGKRGGGSTSAAKKKSSAENGKKGGWPGHFRKKTEPVQEQKQITQVV
jgi:general stress protein YciG